MGPWGARAVPVRVLRVLLFLALAVFTVGTVVRQGHRHQVVPLDVWDYSGIYLLCALLLWCAQPVNRRERLAYRVLGLALVVSTTGDLYFSLVLTKISNPPYPSIADYFYLSWYPLTWVSVVLLLRSRVPRFRASMYLDGLVAGLGAAAVAEAFVLDRLISLTGGSTAEIIVNLSYPVGDLLLILVVVAGTAMLGNRIPRPLLIVTVGLLLTTVADLFFLVQTANHSYSEGGWVDLFWLYGVAVMSMAPDLGRRRWVRRLARPRPRDGLTSFEWTMLTVPAVAIVASAAIVGWGEANRLPRLAVLLADGCILAALARGALTFRELRASEARELAQAHRLARIDELTGLPNRRALAERGGQLLEEASARSPVSLILLDLHNFKEINGSLGHDGGDALLLEVAERVSSTLPEAELVARLGGDEFAALLAGAGPESAIALGHAIRQALAAPFVIEGVRLHVGASLGIATSTRPGTGSAELLRLADGAMYEAKRRHGGIVAYDVSTASTTPDRLRTVEELRDALLGENREHSGHLVVYLQPQLRLRPPAGVDEVAGAEALVRWEHPGRGLLSPAAFLPLAESAGLLQLLADNVVDLALAACRGWWQRGYRIPVAVNLSAVDVNDAALPDRIAAALSRQNLPARALTIELTEDTLMVDQDLARAVLDRLRRQGVAISIDDYGTGYSSLAYLRTLAVDELKLDRTFVAPLMHDPASVSIVRTTVDLAHSLGLRLVAEGIEDADSAELLTELGCDIGQGFHFARPMPGPDLVQWLERRQPRTVPQLPRQPVR